MSSDDELLEAWRDGDTDAGEALFERYYDSVCRFFCNKLREEIDDFVQQTFMACVQGRERMRPGTSFRSYLFGVAHNVLRLHLRARYRNKADDLDQVTAADLSPGPMSIYTRRREEQLLLNALRNLPIEQQTLLELRYWEQLKSEEIAEILGLPANTVRSRLHRAHANLGAVMERLAASPEELASTLENLDAWAQRCREQLVS